MKLSDKAKYEIWDILARIVAVIPPLGATVYFFPEWIKKSSGATWSGMIIVALLIMLIPMWTKFFSLAKDFTLTNASMPVFWLILCGIFYVMQSVADRMIYIGIFGLIGSLISAAVCIKRNQYKKKETESEKDTVEEKEKR